MFCYTHWVWSLSWEDIFQHKLLSGRDPPFSMKALHYGSAILVESFVRPSFRNNIRLSHGEKTRNMAISTTLLTSSYPIVYANFKVIADG
jgi:hypothetical protein